MSDWSSGQLPAILSTEAVSGIRSVLQAVQAAMDAAVARDAFFSLGVTANAPSLPALPKLNGIAIDASVHLLVVPVVGASALNPAALVDPLNLAAQLGLNPDTIAATLSSTITRPEDGVKQLADTFARSLSDAKDLARPLYDEHGAITCIAMVGAANDPADFCAAAAAIEFAANPSHSIMGALAPPPREIRARPGSSGLIELSGAATVPSLLSGLVPGRAALLLAEDPTCLRGKRIEDFLGTSPVAGTFSTQLGRVKCEIVTSLQARFAREAWKYVAVASEYRSQAKTCWSGLSDWTRVPNLRSVSAAASFPDWVMLPNPLALRTDLEKLGQWTGNLAGKTKANDVLARAREKSKASNARAEAALQLLAGSGGGVFATTFSGSGGTSFLLKELTRRLTAPDGPGAVPHRYAAGVFVVIGSGGVGNSTGAFSFSAEAGTVDVLRAPQVSPPVPLFDAALRSTSSTVPSTIPVLASVEPASVPLTPERPLGHDLTPVPSADDRNPSVLITGQEPVKC